MLPNDLNATYNATSGVITIPLQVAGAYDSNNNYYAAGCKYNEGDDENEAGLAVYSSITATVEDNGVITFTTGIIRFYATGIYQGQALTPYWVEGSTLTPSAPPTPVEIPENLEIKEYSLS